MRIASTLFVNTPGSSVAAERGALIVRTPGGQKDRVPVEAIDGVVLFGKASISTEASARCVAAGVRVASLTRSGRVRFVCAPPISGNVHLRVAQLRAADDGDQAFAIAKVIIAGKIRNSRRVVRRWRDDADQPERSMMDGVLDDLAESASRVLLAPSGDHLRGIEGEAARRYFKALGAHTGVLGPPFSMPRRSRRPPADPLNAALSFGYGILNAELIGAADIVGLDPQVGFLHGIRSGRPSLALDLVEEMRAPIVDRFVARALRRRQLRLDHFTETPGGGWYLTDDGRRTYLDLYEHFREQEVFHDALDRQVPLWSLPTIQMTLMARFLRDDLPFYVPWAV